MKKEIPISAHVFYAYQICPREAWFYHHHIDSDKDYEYLNLGKLIHETSYRNSKKELVIDGFLKVDLMRGNIVAEVKKSSKSIKAAKLQLAYYLYFLKHSKGINAIGVLLFPKEKKTEFVELSESLEREIELILKETEKTVNKPKPPIRRKIKYCKSCAFQELCWA